MEQIIFRDLELKDRPAIKALINEAWDWGGGFIEDETTLDATLGLFMNQLLYSTSFAKVAMTKNKIIGVVFGSVKGDIPTGRLLQEDGTAHALTLLNATDHERKNVENYLSKLRHTYGKLIEGNDGSYQGCLELLIASKEARGLGLGKKLVDEMITHFKMKNVENFYLFTDESCNFGFYDHNGFTRRNERKMNLEFNFGSYDVDVFLYDYKI